MSKDAFAIALAIIRHPTDDLILIAQRKRDVHLGGFWEFPGGKCQSGESLAECAAREAQEETGLTVSVLEAWPPIPFEYPERIVTLHPFLCRADSADARPLGNRQIAWVAPPTSATTPSPPPTRPCWRG